MMTTRAKNKKSATSTGTKPAVMTKPIPNLETTPDTSLVPPHLPPSTNIKQAQNPTTPTPKFFGKAIVISPPVRSYPSTINQATVNHVPSRAYNPNFNYPLVVVQKITNSTAGRTPFVNLVKRKSDYE